jgi:hypothetical protein
MRERRMKRLATNAALAAIAVPLAGAMAQVLSPSPVFDGNMTTPMGGGGMQPVHVSIRSWEIAGQETEIPLRGFYVAHLLSGEISATIDGQTTGHMPEDYWTVRSGATMRVKIEGELAGLETIVVAKQ